MSASEPLRPSPGEYSPRPRQTGSNRFIQVQVMETLVDGVPRFELYVVGCGTVLAHASIDRIELLLVNLYVEPVQRGIGIARGIVARAMDIADADEFGRPLKVYYLPDSPARPLFESLGFKDTGARGVEGGSDEYIWAEYTAPPEPDTLEQDGPSVTASSAPPEGASDG